MDDLTLISGAHNYRAGFELRKYYLNIRNQSGSGNFSFSPIQTELPGFAAQTGHSFASFLLGAVSSSNRDIQVANFGYRVTQPSFYFMDDWKITQKLTLNLGLRWEMNFGYNEVAGRMSVIDLTKPNPGAGNRPGALVFADELGRKGFHDKYLKMVSPRLGFAWAINQKLVLRGGCRTVIRPCSIIRPSATSRPISTALVTRRTTTWAFNISCPHRSCSKSATSATRARGWRPTGWTISINCR
jgi:outer membrane receptor protein involved in Fe transport